MPAFRIMRNKSGALVSVPIETGRPLSDEEQRQKDAAARQAVRESPSGLKKLDTNADDYVSAREIKEGLEAGVVTPEEVATAEAERERPRQSVEKLVEKATAEVAVEPVEAERIPCTVPGCTFTTTRPRYLASHIKARHA